MALVGIDLGTTNSVASVNRGVRTDRHTGQVAIPSVVAFLPNGEHRVGKLARRRRAIDSANTIFSSKRIIGRRFGDTETRTFRARYPFDIVEAPDGSPAFRTRAGDLSPSEIATEILRELVVQAGVTPEESEVVITVPADFTSKQIEATAVASAAAGLADARFIDEPSATAYAYLHSDHDCQRALVYDLGGGTFDCAVLDCTTGQPRILAHSSDLHLGGDNIDGQLAAWVSRFVLEKYNWDLANHSETYNRLLARCEDAKIALSTSESAAVHLSQIDPECPADEDAVILSRTLIEELCQDLVHRSFITCDAVLRQSGLRPPDIDSVLLAGGTTRLPFIQQGVESYFGHSGLLDFDPTEVVAVGAGVAAG